MYLYNFFNSIKLLHANSVPEYPDMPSLNHCIYWGIESGDKLIGKSDNVIAKNKYMVFTSLSSLHTHITDVTELENYIIELKIESEINDKIRSVPVTFTHAIIYEAIWLIDIIYTLGHKKTFLTHFDGGLPQLIALLGNNCCEDSPVFIEFKHPIAKDIFLAQSIYFIVKYCNCRLTNYNNVLSEDTPESQSTSITDANTFFIKLLSDIAIEYYENTPTDNWKIELKTGINNTDFDFFIQQIFLISQAK